MTSREQSVNNPTAGRVECPDCSRDIAPRGGGLARHKCTHGAWCDGRCPKCPPHDPRGSLLTVRYDQVQVGDKLRDSAPDAPEPWATVTAILVNDITGVIRLCTKRWCIEGTAREEDRHRKT